MTTLGVIVTYFPSFSLVNNVKNLNDQVDRILLIDNGTRGNALSYLNAAASSHCVELLQLNKNFGIATALNHGIKYALENDFEWFVTFDQDSCVSNNMIKEMRLVYELYPEKDKVAIVAPVSKDANLGDVSHHSDLGLTKGEHLWREVLLTITSGSMMKLSTIERVGYFDDTLFIDCVDFDYCLRVNIVGLRVLEIPSAFLIHRLGERTRHRFLWKEVTVSNHSALRRYYIARNRIILARRYFFFYPRLMVNMVLCIFNHMAKIVFYEHDTIRKILYSFKGIWHGLLGRTGPW